MAQFSSPNGRMTSSGLFSQRTLLIAVGYAREPFHIHPLQLANTLFFKIHGEPPSALEKEQQTRMASIVPDRCDNGMTTPPVEIKQEEGRSPTIGAECRSDVNEDVAQPESTTADYYLTGVIYEPSAFEVVVQWLYNVEPQVPKHRSDCKTLLKAYVLATQYGIEKLQDLIVENFRKFHRDYNLSFDDFMWLVNRFGDTLKTHTIPMVRYYADQLAYEIVSQGYETFVRNNRFFAIFIQDGDRPLRSLIFEAVARTGGIPNHVDPALGANRWRVRDKHTSPAQPNTVVDMIEIDDED